MQQRQWCHKLTDPPPLLHGRVAALHTFCHFTKTCGACWWQMLHSTCPRGHKWPFGLSFLFFFPVTKNYLFDDGHHCNPRHPDGAGGCCCLSSEITFTSDKLCLCVRERSWVSWMCVCLCTCMSTDMIVDVHVWEDASLTAHRLFDAFNKA